MNAKTILQALKKAKTILVSAHVNPDPDALCSELALAGYLKAKGKKVIVVNEGVLPQRLAFLPGARIVKVYQKGMSVNYDVAVVLDCGDIDRIGDVQALIRKDKPLINIDHHITNTRFGSLNFVDVEASSTAEMLFELFQQDHFKLTKNIALHLYSGIMTDTGSFRYENTTPRTHEIASALTRFKFSTSSLYREFYESMPLEDVKVFTRVVSTFESLFGGKVLVVELPKKITQQLSKAFDLRDTIFKFLRTIRGAEVFVIFTEVKPKLTRVNFRSSNEVNVAQLANRFGGGGHRRASGCVIEERIKQARKEILRAVKKVV